MRLTLQIHREGEISGHLRMQLFVNCQPATLRDGLHVRRSEAVAFVLRLKPDSVVLDRENIPPDTLMMLEQQLGPIVQTI